MSERMDSLMWELQRYGEVYDDLADVLEDITDINDNQQHGRDATAMNESIDKAIRSLEAMRVSEE